MYDLNDISNTNGLHIAHLNVRSMVNKCDNIKANFLDSGIHVLSFSETWPNLAKNCQMHWFYSGNESVGSLSDIETTKDEIIDICKNININKASSVDNISSEVLRDAFLAVPEKLCLLFNTCFNTASIPNCWKYAKVTPLPKGGNSQSVSN